MQVKFTMVRVTNQPGKSSYLFRQAPLDPEAEESKTLIAGITIAREVFGEVEVPKQIELTLSF